MKTTEITVEQSQIGKESIQTRANEEDEEEPELVQILQQSQSTAQSEIGSDKQICVELLNDIVEMASDTKSPVLIGSKSQENRSMLDGRHNEDPLALPPVLNAATTKRRRSIEVYVSMTGGNESPITSSTGAKRLRSNSLKNDSKLDKIAESSSSPDLRTISPDQGCSNILSPAVISTTNIDKDQKIVDLPNKCHRIVDYDDDVVNENVKEKKRNVRKSPEPTSLVLRPRSRSLVIDVRNSELSLKQTIAKDSKEFAPFTTTNKRGRPKQQKSPPQTKRPKVDTPTSPPMTTELDDASTSTLTKDVDGNTKIEVQHPDISSSTTSTTSNTTPSCRYNSRKCCYHVATIDETEMDEEEEEMEANSKYAVHHHHCHHHSVTVDAFGCVKPVGGSSSKDRFHRKCSCSQKGESLSAPGPVTIQQDPNTSIPTVSINLNTEIVVRSHGGAGENNGPTNIIHINSGGKSESNSGSTGE